MAMALPQRLVLRTFDGFKQPLLILWQQRRLLGLLLRRDIAVRTSGTTMGGVWLFVQPTLQILAFWFLLDMVLRIRFPGTLPFVEYFLVGMVPWLMMADAMNRSVNVMGEFAPLYAKTLFPMVLLPMLPLLVAGMIYGTVYIGLIAVLEGVAKAALAPLIVLSLMLWLMPICFLLALVGVFLRDVGQAIPFLITMTFYLTPILYMPEMLPEIMQPAMVFNPFADIMALLHGVLQGTEMTWGNLLRPFLLWLLLLGPAWVLFFRAMPHVRESL